jgi:ribonucleoside-diphosphate reductase alpha chain
VKEGITMMQVTKRNGEKEIVSFDKITQRIRLLADKISPEIDPIRVAQKVCNSLYDNVTTSELDELSAEISISLCTENTAYGTLAAHLCVNNLHKTTSESFVDTITKLYKAKKVTQQVYEVACEHKDVLHDAIDYDKDYLFDYFGIKTLQKSYLLKIGKTIVERPQSMWMRVSLGIHGKDIQSAIETYKHMSNMCFTHATPTLFNAGTDHPQMSSCFLMELEDDSINGIYKSLQECAQISKYAGGIGMHIHKLRATGSDIRNVKNACTGIVPSLRVFNATSRYVNQSGHRPGSIAIYLSVDHADIYKFLDLKKNHGDEEERCRDLFYGAWIPDLFMRRVKEDGMWSLFCPNKVGYKLENVYGEEYEALYEQLERDQKYVRQVKAQHLWFAICNSQIETGTPYIVYKDAVNRKSNQQNVGIIKSSNLCTEIVEYTSPDEIAVCNLASISLPSFITEDLQYDHNKLHDVVKVITTNLNRIIDVNFYPVEKARVSNMRHRPIGIGVQGLADVYMRMRLPFDSKEAAKLNMDIFETIYHASMERSMELAIKEGVYNTFEGSPVSQGTFQFDMWGEHEYKCGSGRYDWDALKEKVKKHGVRNSLLVAPMPTASTSQILGNNECIEPYTSNIYLRRTLAGEFVVVNKHLIKDLTLSGLWNESLKNQIISHNGSIQNIDIIPHDLKQLYKTAWEIKQRNLIDQAADRGMYVCQSQSLNLFVARPDLRTLSSMHFHGWSRGLKTGMYYLRTTPASEPVKVSLRPECESCSG